jgi:hypothetical protein
MSNLMLRQCCKSVGELRLCQGREFYRKTKLWKSCIFILPSKQNFSVVLFEIYRFYQFVYTTCEFNDEIMKKALGNS